MPEFDLVAPVYDATRPAPTETELAATLAALEGCREVLEAGVGTGRYSVPLTERGLRMTGIDIAPEMMRRAREKGLARLVRADLHRLPFRDRAFDGALIVHVLQLIPDPFDALAELLRVASDRVTAIFPVRSEGSRQRRERFRGRYRELAAARGIAIPPRTRYWDNGARLLETCPPSRVQHLEVTVARDPDRERAWADLRAFGGLISVPEEVHREIVAQIRAERPAEDRPEPHRVRHLTIATWRADRRAEVWGHRGSPPSPAAA